MACVQKISGKGKIKEEAQVYTYAFEDITIIAGDCDSNDIILKVKIIHVNSKVEVTLVAACAKENVEVYYNNSQYLFGGEVHAVMECQFGEMINTGRGVVDKEIVDRSIDRNDGYTLKEYGNFSLCNVKEMCMKFPAFYNAFKSGDVPYEILVPNDRGFFKEKQRVKGEYSNFVI